MTVSLAANQSTTMLGIIGINSLDVSATSTARVKAGSPVCLHILNKTMDQSLVASGGSTLDATPCVVWVNSSSYKAVTLSGGSHLNAAMNCIHGGFSQGYALAYVVPQDCGIRDDPFASMNPTTPSNCTFSKFASGEKSVTISPGVYCGGLTLSGGPTVTVQPGVYVIRDSKLTMSGGGSMTGKGVVFVIEGTSTVDLSGGGSYSLTAPTSGPLAGFVFFQRPTASPGQKANLSGTGSLYYQGVLYFPTQNAIISGGSTTATSSPFTAYIANSVTYSGTSGLKINYDPPQITVPIPNGIFSNTPSVYLSN
jgi:hypothetical protein